MPFFESFKEVQIRPETVQVIVHCIEAETSAANLFHFQNISSLFQLEPVLAITRDGIENTFREITIITTIR